MPSNFYYLIYDICMHEINILILYSFSGISGSALEDNVYQKRLTALKRKLSDKVISKTRIPHKNYTFLPLYVRVGLCHCFL